MGVQLNAQPEPTIACVDVEQELLGAILNNNEACDLAARFIEADDFAEPIHRNLFASFAAARNEGRAITITLAKAALGGDAKIELMPGCTVGEPVPLCQTLWDRRATTLRPLGRSFKRDGRGKNWQWCLAMRRQISLCERSAGNPVLRRRGRPYSAIRGQRPAWRPVENFRTPLGTFQSRTG
jgi:hypothetical protein